MAKKHFGTKLLTTVLATFALASCQSESTLLEPVADNLCDVELTVIASKGEVTRTNLNLSEDQKKLLLTWKVGDIIHVSENDGLYTGTLKVTELLEEGTKAKFKGTIRTIKENGKRTFKFSYLGAEDPYTGTRNQQAEPKVYDFTSQVNSGVNALAQNDLLVTDGEVDIQDGKATFENLFMSRQFAFGRFTLIYNDKALEFGENTVVTINTSTNDIQTGATFDFKSENVTSVGGQSISLTTSDNDFYVTFVPGSKESAFKFNVTVNGEEYEGYSAEFLIEKNDFFRRGADVEVGEAMPIYMKKTDGSDDAHDFTLIYNKNFGNKDTWKDSQNVVGNVCDFNVKEYNKIFNDEEGINEGYDFVEWNTEADGSGTRYAENSVYTMNRANGTEATLYAIWKESEYTWNVTWKDGYTEKPVKKENYTGKNNYDISGEYPADPTREGYTFSHWAPQVSKLTKDQLEVEIVAQWKKNIVDYKLTYHQNLNGSTLTVDETPDPATTADSYDFTVVKYDDLGGVWTSTHDGYDFIGWNTKADGTGKGYAAGDSFNVTVSQPTGNLYAQWVKSNIDYSIIYEDTNGTQLKKYDFPSKLEKVDVNVNDNAPQVTAPAGYEFKGWAVKGTTEVKTSVELTKAKPTVTVVPVFAKKPTVSTPGYDHGTFN
ncbi:MAG: InlB B-repeat-containing protein [Muribaculaceae bacterium]|nr:InlB B-repeat-containing protein [Muribaculaceae bacterium]